MGEGPHDRRWLAWALSGLGLLVAVAAVAVALIALQRSSTLKTELRHAQRQVRALSDNSEVAETSARVAYLSEEWEKVGPKLGALITCVPELQTEVDGLGIEWEIPGTFSEKKPYFAISNDQQISSNCDNALYGTKE